MVLAEKALSPPMVSRIESIEALANVSSNPARRRVVPSGTVHPWKRDAAWAQVKLSGEGRSPGGPASPTSPTAAAAENAVRVPRVSQPLRVEPPTEYNAPTRAQRLTNKHSARHATEVLSSKLARRPLLGQPTTKARPEKMKDYAVLANACQRAGRPTRAAHLIFNQGVLYENMGETQLALKCYKELLRASLEAGDAVGKALACNCIGVAFQLQGSEAEMSDAVRYHQQHLAVADVPGKFIAHCNLGLAYQALNRLQEAATNHQHALRYAIRMSSLAGESLACGHLGMIGATDAETSKACTERQLQLARTLQDHRAKEDAYLQLGGLAHASGSHDQAHHYFTAALEEADRQHDAETADLARCQLGLADGGHEFEAFLQAQQQM